MAAGMIVRDASGNVVIDLTTRLTRLIGIITPARNGSLTDAGFATGTPFAVPCNSSASEEYSITLNITFSGNTMTWRDQDNLFNGTNYPAPFTIIYGVY